MSSNLPPESIDPDGMPEPGMTEEAAGTPASAPDAPPQDAAEDAAKDDRGDADAFSDLGLHLRLVRPLRDAGFVRPWPIQAAAIPPALAGRDVIGLAPTGRGKTIAFLAPMAQDLLLDTLEKTRRGTGRRRSLLPPAERLRGLVLSPTRELAQQIAAEAERLLVGTRHTVTCAYGKVSVRPQLDAIHAGCDVLVATPGRLHELVVEHDISLAHVRAVAVDEVDRMLDMGFLPQVRSLLERLPKDRRSAFFTATLPDAVATLAGRFLRDPVRVEAGRHTHAAEHVEQHLVRVENHDKVPLLLRLFQLGHGRGTLVFCGTRRRVGWVAAALARHDIRVGQLHGDRSQKQRDDALRGFRDGELDVLVSTDVTARGLHIDRVRTVINYDVPNDAEEYVHRVGRAGHGGGFGESFTLLGRRDLEKWERIVWNVADPLPIETVDGFEPTSPPRRDATDRRPPRTGDARVRSGGRGGRGGRGDGGGQGGEEVERGERRERGGRGGGGGRGGSRGGPRDAAGGRRGGRTGSRDGRGGGDRPGKNRSRRASKPISPDQKPGGGVRRPKDD